MLFKLLFAMSVFHISKCFVHYCATFASMLNMRESEPRFQPSMKNLEISEFNGLFCSNRGGNNHIWSKIACALSCSLIVSNVTRRETDPLESLTKQKSCHFMLSKVEVGVVDGSVYQSKISFSIIKFKCNGNKLTYSIYYLEFCLI